MDIAGALLSQQLLAGLVITLAVGPGQTRGQSGTVIRRGRSRRGLNQTLPVTRIQTMHAHMHLHPGLLGHQFKKAALRAKQNGDLVLAKKYLQQANGFKGMIEASQAGLPVDMSNVPAPPGVDTEKLEFVSDVSGSDGGGTSGGDRNEQYKKLEQDLIQQIRVR